MLLCHLLYPTCIYQVPLIGSTLGQRWVNAGSTLLPSRQALSSSADDHNTPHPGPNPPEPPSSRSLDILLYICVLYCYLFHASSHSRGSLENTSLGAAAGSKSSDESDDSSTAPLDGFRIPSLASVCPAKACVYSTVVSAHLCCLASMLLALVGLA